MKYGIKSLWCFLICLLVILTPCAADVHAETTKREQITIAQYGKERFLLYLPIYVAMEQGLFDKRGIDVNLKFAGGDDQVFSDVTHGSADFGFGDPAFVAISHDKGGPGKVVGMMLTSLATRGVTNNDKVPVISNPKDLSDLRISSPAAPSTTYTILNNLKNSNHLKTLSIIQTSNGEQMSLLEAGKIDIATDIEPNISIYEDKGYRPVLDLSQWTPPQAIAGIITTDDLIKKRPQTVQNVVDSIQEAIDLMYRNHAVCYGIAKKIYPQLSDNIINESVDSLLRRHVYPRTVAIDDGLWQRTIKARMASGEIKNLQSLPVSVNNYFAIRARKDLAYERKVVIERRR